MVSQEQRRKQLAREKRIRQHERREAAQRQARKRNALIGGALVTVLAVVGGLFAAGVFDGDDAEATSGPCAEPAKGKPKKLSFPKEPAMSIDKSAAYRMKLDTTCGDIDLSLDAKAAPHTVNSFNFLVGKGYLDHTRCHRLTKGNVNVLQCGDPTGTSEGDPGYSVPDENLDSKRLSGGVYPAGTVAMANTYNATTGKGRDSGGSQFFLVYADSQLPPDYTPFGTVSADGMRVLKKIADEGESTGQGDGPPSANVVIDKARVTRS
ncbi:peptidylprolyl isomerase [Streptomyces sp. NA04227]|uniref:peptidylprolyl isomerase n=1 Tax=Streptomyces sp. NA04227 TaxID=2742136 RepID=UPI00158FBEFC|nr:peptidylprolyl isomerase [Streptomyces sp. NA04227]QKW05513.1 peptidylprolyl isomerase [Streptomyces sp. NA04227]